MMNTIFIDGEEGAIWDKAREIDPTCYYRAAEATKATIISRDPACPAPCPPRQCLAEAAEEFGLLPRRLLFGSAPVDPEPYVGEPAPMPPPPPPEDCVCPEAFLRPKEIVGSSHLLGAPSHG